MTVRKVVFRLKRGWQTEDGRTVDLYEEFRSGRKTIEYRDVSPYWLKRLCDMSMQELWDMPEYWKAKAEGRLFDLTDRLVVKRVWLTIGMPKNNLPRFEADVIKLMVDTHTGKCLLMPRKFHIHLANVEEILTN